MAASKDKIEEIPAFVAQLYAQKRWPELVYIMRAKWSRDAWLYLKRNQNAVRRIKEEFTKLTKNPPYRHTRHNAKFFDQEIAKYVDRLGVAALIDDMREACAKVRIQSIVYFLWSAEHKPRWEMLLLKKLEQEYLQQKESDNEAYAALAKIIGGEIIQKMQVEPDWVQDCRRRREHYKKQLTLDLPADHRRQIEQDIARLERALTSRGFQP